MLSIEIIKIELTGKERRMILSGANFTIEPNHIYTILGKNGSGKTTLIKSFTRLLDKNYIIDGKFTFNGVDILSTDDNTLRNIRGKIKYIFQDAVNSFNPLKKIGWYFNTFAAERDIESILKYFILPPAAELFKLYPYELSGGMAQRVSLALALLTEPELLILDEPASGIDTPISNLVLHKLKEYAAVNNNSVLLVTQDVEFARAISSKIALLEDGKLPQFLSPADFFSKYNFYEPTT